MKISKAALKRKLTPGTKLTLINSLIGTCSKPREVKRATSSGYMMLTPEGLESRLYIGSDDEVIETPDGFKIQTKVDQRLMAEYTWVKE